MDLFISDRWETPAGSEHLYTERLLRLPDGYVCYSAPPYAPDVAPLPADAGGARDVRLLQQPGEDHAGAPSPPGRACCSRVPGVAAGAEDAPVLRPDHRRADARGVRRPRHRPGADRDPRLLLAPRATGAARRDRHRARPVPLFGRADHLRGAVDGRAGGHAAGREFRLAPLGEPSAQCRARRLGRARPRCLCRDRCRAGRRPARRCAGCGRGCGRA